MRFLKTVLLFSIFALVLAGCGSSKEETSKGEKVIIGLDPYDYSKVPVYLANQILEDQGYETEISSAQDGILWAALAEGEIDAYGDIWSPNISASYIEQYEGEYVTAGTIFSDAPVGVAVPEYMDEITSIDQLNEMKDEFDGKIYTIDHKSATAISTLEMVEAYDLDYEVVNSSEAAMVAQARKAISQNEAIAFIGWRPHMMFKKLDIKLLDDPDNFWLSDNIQWGVATDVEERLPEAYTLFSNMNLTIEEIERWLVEMDEGKSPEQLAEEWIAENKETVEEWLEQ